MGVITVFALDDCPFCKKTKELLNQKGLQYSEISLTRNPAWKSLMFLLTNGEVHIRGCGQQYSGPKDLEFGLRHAVTTHALSGYDLFP